MSKIDVYHGAHSAYVNHIGQCWTDEELSAEFYAGDSGFLAIGILDMSRLVVIEFSPGEGYDRDTDTAPGDDNDNYGADVLIYGDEDPRGNYHVTWRLMTQAAIDAIEVVEVFDLKEKRRTFENKFELS